MDQTLGDDKERLGHEAHRILNSEAFREAVARVETSTIERWKKAQSAEEREDLHRLVLLLATVVAELRSMWISGQIEKDANGFGDRRANEKGDLA
ncbi:MAG: hypothetical protein AAGB03_02525 [Pseudomonadota bacterium]